MKEETFSQHLFRNGMTASGEIITEDKRLIERFLKEFMKVFER